MYGPAVPTEGSCILVEWSIRGLMVPACGVAIAKVAVREAGGWDVRSWDESGGGQTSCDFFGSDGHGIDLERGGFRGGNVQLLLC